MGDLKWLTLYVKFCNCSDYIEWCDYIKVHFKSVKRDAKMFAKLHIAKLHESRASAAAHECAPGEFACEMCQCNFNSFQKLSLHRFKKHNAKNVWRLYAAHHTHCRVCLQQFWSRERLLNHLRYRSKICKYNVQLRGPMCNEATACEIDLSLLEANAALQRKGKRRHCTVEPAIRLVGPLLPILLPDEVKSSSHHPLGMGHNY